jgi:hypothetical protein
VSPGPLDPGAVVQLSGPPLSPVAAGLGHVSGDVEPDENYQTCSIRWGANLMPPSSTSGAGVNTR